jgi:hypothetical protein
VALCVEVWPCSSHEGVWPKWVPQALTRGVALCGGRGVALCMHLGDTRGVHKQDIFQQHLSPYVKSLAPMQEACLNIFLNYYFQWLTT